MISASSKPVSRAPRWPRATIPIVLVVVALVILLAGRAIIGQPVETDPAETAVIH